MAAPANHKGGRLSRNMSSPKKAVKRKFVEVFRMETRVVEELSVRARVKSAHIRALKARLREKNI
jgi:hypothetical protein